nr:MarR family transcriptional regulator [Frankia sp. QA3]
MTEALAPLGLTHVQFVLLACTWWLNTQGHQPNQVTIADQAATDVKMTSEILRKLESRGLVRRGTDTQDTRAKVVIVTEAGAVLARRAVMVMEQADAEFFAGISGSFVDQMRELAAFVPPERP